MKRIELVPGTRFGKLTVVSEAEQKGHTRYINCICDCGNECVTSLKHLRDGSKTHCGCLSKNSKPESAESLINRRYGNLVIIDEADKKNGKRYMRCRCDCGNETEVLLDHLRSSHTKSCGCLAEKYLKSRSKDITGQRFGRLVALHPSEAEKQNKNSIVWKCICDCGKEFYSDVQSLLSGNTQSCGCLHKDFCNEKLRENLHFVDGTCIESLTTRKKSANNTSGYRGVSYSSRDDVYVAEIMFKGKKHYLGKYKKLEDAVKARLKGEEMFVDFLEEYYTKQESNDK